MHLKVRSIIESLLILGLFIPSGMLLATQPNEGPAARTDRAEWNNSAQATNLFNQIQTLSYKVRREVERLQVQDEQLDWQYQGDRLAATKLYVNDIGNDLANLDHVRSNLAPWQKSLVNKVTPNVHDMAYQLDAAIHGLDAHQNHMVLLLTQYPQNINMIYKSANTLADTIGAVTQSARAEHMAALERPAATGRS